MGARRQRREQLLPFRAAPTLRHMTAVNPAEVETALPIPADSGGNRRQADRSAS